MKKNNRKLALRKETLRSLDPSALRGANGGATATVTITTISIQYCTSRNGYMTLDCEKPRPSLALGIRAAIRPGERRLSPALPMAKSCQEPTD